MADEDDEDDEDSDEAKDDGSSVKTGIELIATNAAVPVVNALTLKVPINLVN